MGKEWILFLKDLTFNRELWSLSRAERLNEEVLQRRLANVMTQAVKMPAVVRVWRAICINPRHFYAADCRLPRTLALWRPDGWTPRFGLNITYCSLWSTWRLFRDSDRNSFVCFFYLFSLLLSVLFHLAGFSYKICNPWIFYI